MLHIINLVFLGLVAGLIACFWTRIIKTNMILGKLGKWLSKKNNMHVINTTEESILIMFVRCAYCIPPWLMLILGVFYVIVFHPWWPFAVIGILGGMGAGNLVAEFICSMRNDP